MPSPVVVVAAVVNIYTASPQPPVCETRNCLITPDINGSVNSRGKFRYAARRLELWPDDGDAMADHLQLELADNVSTSVVIR